MLNFNIHGHEYSSIQSHNSRRSLFCCHLVWNESLKWRVGGCLTHHVCVDVERGCIAVMFAPTGVTAVHRTVGRWDRIGCMRRVSAANTSRSVLQAPHVKGCSTKL